jgi:hypothetical protein
MATKKPSKKTAKVQLDAETVHKFEEHLRDGLVASGAVIAAENKTPNLKAGAKVELDPETTARLSKALQKGLVSSGAVIATELAKFGKAKAKGKGKTKGKGYSPRPAAKKR